MPKATHPRFCTRDHAPGEPHTAALEHLRLSRDGHEAIVTLQYRQRPDGTRELYADIITEPGLLTFAERSRIAQAAGTAFLNALR